MEMIKLSVSNKDVFVWNANDWSTLREKHRIVGNLIGCLASLPRQDAVSGLPLQLLPEEVAFLLKKKVAKLVGYKELTDSVESKAQYDEYKLKNQKEQVAFYEEERKKQVISMLDRIVEGKRRKLNSAKAKANRKDGDEAAAVHTEIDRDVILKNELEKASNVPLSNTLVQTFTADVWNSDSMTAEVNWEFPSTDEEKLRCRVFDDLWEKGYYITSGQKFGGDFLVYPGDPVKFHAQFIVACVPMESSLTAYDLLAFGRLGSSTRKTVAIASIDRESDSLVYQSLNWAENSV